MIFFDGAIGQVVKVDGPIAEAAMRFFDLDNDAISGQLDRVIITRVTVAQAEDIQTSRVGSDLYVYAYGARPGTIGISGLAFSGACDGYSEAGPVQPFHGAGRFFSWYQANRASKRQAPIELVVAGTVFQGVLAGMSADVTDPSTFAMQIGGEILTLPSA